MRPETRLRLWVSCGLLSSVLALTACGSVVAVDEDTETSGTGPEVTTMGESAPEAMGTTSGDESSSGSASTDGFTADVPPESEECWHREPLFEAPLQAPTSVADQDGDGADEIWLQVIFGNDADDTSPVFALDRQGEVIVEHTIDGIFRNLADVDGDGYLDIGAFQLGAGQPLPRYVPADGAWSFESSFLALELPSDFLGTAGFFDLTQDGVADVFRLTDSGALEFLRGDGAAGFEATGSVAFPDATGILAFPIDRADNLAVVHTATRITSAGQPDDCSPQDFFLVDVAREGTLSIRGASAPALDFGQYYRAAVPPGARDPEVFVGTCASGKTTYDVRMLSVSDNGVLVETPVIHDAVWAAVFDHNGDGVLDVAHLDEVGAEILIDERSPADGDVRTISTGIEGSAVPTNRAFPADLDGDGREELVLAGEDLGNGSHRYELLYVDTCG